jgi:hypothetical protein
MWVFPLEVKVQVTGKPIIFRMVRELNSEKVTKNIVRVVSEWSGKGIVVDFL